VGEMPLITEEPVLREAFREGGDLVVQGVGSSTNLASYLTKVHLEQSHPFATAAPGQAFLSPELENDC
jgi:hypothetical protein